MIRAVLLDAIVRAASESSNIGVAFVTSARNVLPFTEASNERAIWANVVGDIEQRVDVRSETEWTTPEKINVPAMVFQTATAIKVSPRQRSFDREALEKTIEAAAGPTNAKGRPTGGNQYWPNSSQQWASEFAPRLAKGIATAIDTLTDESETPPIDLTGPLEGLVQAVSTYVESALKAVSGATAGLERRTNLIWWKHALYSPSARCSYRMMPASTAAALMAFDLYRQVPTFSPASVAAFLHETVLTLPSLDPNESRPIRALLTEALGSKELEPLRHAAAEAVPKPTGRGPVLGLIGHDPGGALLDDRAFRDLVGVPADTALKTAEWATWLFRELQAARATQEGTEVKKRGRKS